MKTITFLILALMIGGQVMGQQPAQLKLDHLTLEDGLSQSSGYTILQDHKGYMWFGTQNGLNKYNGYDFTIYRHDPADSSTISSSGSPVS
jgi:two-component system, sensor histidine kinase ChiS